MSNGLKKYIHVNKHKIASNLKHGTDDPVITAKTYKSNDYAKQVDILDEQGNVVASLVQEMDKPLSCGARVYIVTNATIKVGDKVIK